MPRKGYIEDDEDSMSTFSEDYRSTRKYMQPGTRRLASHSKKKVAYFHDEGVGNYHYGVIKKKYHVVYTQLFKLYRSVIL
jgi:hypothetical protein